jgi:hypothetical protein
MCFGSDKSNGNITWEYAIRNTWKVLKCGGGEGWRRSVGLSM